MKLLFIFLLFPIVVHAKCKETKVVNMTDEWNDSDEKQLQDSKKKCKEIYGKDTPCLVVFTKRDKNTYRALCGSEK